LVVGCLFGSAPAQAQFTQQMKLVGTGAVGGAQQGNYTFYIGTRYR
jgi:hypothetical protein